MKKSIESRFVALTVAVWSCLVAGVVLAFAWYDVRPASSNAVAPAVFPTQTQILSPVSNQPRTVVAIFVHPRCPCSRASLTELAHLIRNHPNDTEFHIIFFKPTTQSFDWVRSDNLYTKALAMANGAVNVTVSIDDDGKEAERFHADVSGFTVAYDQQGHLLFSGGITASRGHEGKNAGEEALRSAIEHQQGQYTGVIAHSALAPVFGCGIHTNPTN